MPERAVSVRDSHNRGAATTSASASSRGAASGPRRGLYRHRLTTTTEQRIRSPSARPSNGWHPRASFSLSHRAIALTNESIMSKVWAGLH